MDLPVMPSVAPMLAQGDRFRHTSQFVRWRPDRDPASCTFGQLEKPVRFDLTKVLRGELAGSRET